MNRDVAREPPRTEWRTRRTYLWITSGVGFVLAVLSPGTSRISNISIAAVTLSVGGAVTLNSRGLAAETADKMRRAEEQVERAFQLVERTAVGVRDVSVPLAEPGRLHCGQAVPHRGIQAVRGLPDVMYFEVGEHHFSRLDDQALATVVHLPPARQITEAS